MSTTHSTPGPLVVVALLVTAGCQGLYGSSASSSDQRAVDAVDRAQEAALDVTSYRYTTDGQVQMRDDSRSRSVEQTVTVPERDPHALLLSA